jgi:sulfite dehydrogenase (quinone) subunit SoeC
MHPAPSIILFTSLSGLGFGLLFFFGLGPPYLSGWVAFTYFTLAFGLAVGGLLASTFHLGNPQRAVKAFRQWRSSWLSREGVAAVATLVVFGLYAIMILFFTTRIVLLGYLGSVLALITVYSTAMIYTQMKTVPRWNHATTPALFLLYALGGGALLAGQVQAATALIALLTVVQALAWMIGDGRFGAAGSTIATATGLGNLGKVRLLESPHSGGNYLLREMVFTVGRKHSQKLRLIALLCIGIIPVTVMVLVPVGHALGFLLIALHLTGLFISRWLFFAEAEHVVGLYYDKR